MISILFLVFVAAQGAAIVGTALLLSWKLGQRGWLAKIGLTAASYLGWVAFTLLGYTMLGGEGGFMDGMGLMLSLCSFALVSSTIYLVVWLAAPLFRNKVHG